MKVVLILMLLGWLAFTEAAPGPLRAPDEISVQPLIRYVRSPEEAPKSVERYLEGSETAYGAYYYPHYWYHHYPYYYLGK